MRPLLGGLACASLLVATLVPGVLGAGPDVWRDSYVLDLDAPSVSAACGFSVHRHEVGKYTGQDFEDGTGLLHGQLTTTWAANGRTADEHDDFTARYDVKTGFTIISGTWYHLTGPAVGAIQLDNGLLGFDADGDLIFSAGPAPSAERDVDALCAYLAA